MKLIATRHAETNYNIKDLVNYDPAVDVHLTKKGIKQAKDLVNYDPAVDVHLTKKGIKQAKDLAEQLKDFKFDAIYVSRLKRTKQTADIINRYHQQNLLVNKLLDDTRNGFEGRPYDEAKGWRDAQPDPVSARYLDKFESVSDMTIRVQKFIDYLKRHHKSNETILIITSSHIIKQLRMLYGEITMEELLNAPAKHATYYEFNL